MNRSPPPVVTEHTTRMTATGAPSSRLTLATQSAQATSYLKKTATTHFSEDAKNENKVYDAETKIPAGIFIPQHALSWGGVSTNNIADKWK